MKNLILNSVFVAAAVTSLSANAAGEQTFCNGGASGDATVAATASASDFVKVAFRPKCSANVFLVGNDRSALVYTVGAASIKGKSRFGGSSVGGSVGREGDCGATPCAATDAQAASNAQPSS
jgi:hypothetical protein